MSTNPRVINIDECTKIEKPWGYEILWAETKDYVAKLMSVNSNQTHPLV